MNLKICKMMANKEVREDIKITMNELKLQELCEAIIGQSKNRVKELEIIHNIVNEVFEDYTRQYFFWVGLIFVTGYCVPFYALMKLDFDF